jgi:hypothetical protein
MSSKSNYNNTYDNNRYVKLLQQFPKIKFSYELKSYKKVSTSNNTDIYDNDSVYSIIPKGKKYFVWFKNGECLFLELDNDKQVVHVTSKKTSRIFPNDTILYGTHFYYRIPTNVNLNSLVNIQYYFTIENIHYYNGVNIDATQTVFEKLKTLHLAFRTVPLEKTFQVDIGLPHIDVRLERIYTIKPFYQIYCIQKKKTNDTTNQYQNINLNFNILSTANFATQPNKRELELKTTSMFTPQKTPTSPIIAIQNNNPLEPSKQDLDKINNHNNHNNHNSGYYSKYKIFIVSPDIQNDIYYLVDPDTYTNNANNTTCISNKLIASIPDYKTSVMMNALFRNIKENISLDALEESDDEDEFENTNIDKFVDLTKKIKMKCIFNYKFKKWTPIECVK